MNPRFPLSVVQVVLTDQSIFHYDIKMEHLHHSIGAVFARFMMNFLQIHHHSLLDHLPVLLPQFHSHPVMMPNPTFPQTSLFKRYLIDLVYITSILVASHYTHQMNHTIFPKLLTPLILLRNPPQPLVCGSPHTAPLFSQSRIRLVLRHMHPSLIYLYSFL